MSRTHLPIFGDPSHGTGKWGADRPHGQGVHGRGADGVMIEVHPRPEVVVRRRAQVAVRGEVRGARPGASTLAWAVGRTL